EGEHGNEGNEEETGEGGGGEEQRTAPTPLGIVHRTLRLEARPPREHRVRENVVEDLVLRGARAVRRARADDALGGESAQDVLGFLLVDGRVAGEVAHALRDLRPRRRDEEVVHRRRGALLTGRELGHLTLQVVLDDLRGAAQLAEGGEPQGARAAA